LGKDESFCTRYGQKLAVKLPIRSRHRAVTSTTWAKEIYFILHDMRVDKDHFKEVMKWYLTKGQKLKYVPRIFKVRELVEKFRAIEDAWARVQDGEQPLEYVEDDDPRRCGYYDGSD
jgi:hypothetical protein